jgi:hypothetical protein
MYLGDYGDGVRHGCIEPSNAHSDRLILPVKTEIATDAWISRHADGKVPHQTSQNALTDKSDVVYSTCSIVREN